ncbi:MAG TPA: NBR1-Ig-like domain-containing protein [Anaerolineales bacterium]|jgi:hypothetical protein
MKLKLALLILVSALVAAACSPSAPQGPTPDVVAIRTSAAKTVVAEITLTAAASTATASATLTETPPTETPALETPLVVDGTIASGTAVLCDHLAFDPATVDVNIPDNSEMTPGQEFVKTWKIKNDGGCAWGAGYALVFSYGTRMSGQPQPLVGVVSIGQEVEVSVNFKAPSEPDEYLSAWQLANDKGIPFPKVVFVKIVVK